MNAKQQYTEFLAQAGLSADDIAREEARQDQADAWIREAGPLAGHADAAARRSDWDQVSKASFEISRRIEQQLDVSADSPAGQIIVALLAECAAAAHQIRELARPASF